MKSKSIFLCLVASAMFASCKQFKKPKFCVNIPENIELGEQVTFTWCDVHADYITWRNPETGEGGEGKSFTTSFSKRGQNRLEVTAKNKIGSKKVGFKEEESFDFLVGEKSYLFCHVRSSCSEINGLFNSTGIPTDRKNHTAYLYATRADWVKDVDNGNHNSCLDSVSCKYYSKLEMGGGSYRENVFGGYFKKTFPVGTVVYVSVEYRNPDNTNLQYSNWGSFFSGNEIKIDRDKGYDNEGYLNVDVYSKKLLQLKWKLTSIYINGNPVSVPDCNKDDYIKFYANGTWKYNVGNDNCNGTSIESMGAYGSYHGSCDGNSIYVSMTTTSGSLTGFSGAYFINNFAQFEITAYDGSNSVKYLYTSQDN